MRRHNICFALEIRKNIFELYSNPPLSRALISSITGLLHNMIMTPNIQEYLSLNTDGSNSIVISRQSICSNLLFYVFQDGLELRLPIVTWIFENIRVKVGKLGRGPGGARKRMLFF